MVCTHLMEVVLLRVIGSGQTILSFVDTLNWTLGSSLHVLLSQLMLLVPKHFLGPVSL